MNKRIKVAPETNTAVQNSLKDDPVRHILNNNLCNDVTPIVIEYAKWTKSMSYMIDSLEISRNQSFRIAFQHDFSNDTIVVTVGHEHQRHRYIVGVEDIRILMWRSTHIFRFLTFIMKRLQAFENNVDEKDVDEQELSNEVFKKMKSFTHFDFIDDKCDMIVEQDGLDTLVRELRYRLFFIVS